MSSKLLELETSNSVSGFDLSLLIDCRFLHSMVYCEVVRSAILATAWLLVFSRVRHHENHVLHPLLPERNDHGLVMNCDVDAMNVGYSYVQ